MQKPSSSLCFVEYSLLSGLRCSHKAFFVENIIGKEPVAFNLKELLLAAVYYKYNPVFWYLFQLLLLVLLAPFLYDRPQKKVWPGLAAFAYICFVEKCKVLSFKSGCFVLL